MDMPDQRLKALVQGVDKLKSLGIEQTTLPLPKIVVVGDQSAGKIAVRLSLCTILRSILIKLTFSWSKKSGTNRIRAEMSQAWD